MIDFIKKYKPTKWWHYIIIGVILFLAYFLPSCRAVWSTDGKINIETTNDQFPVLPKQEPDTAIFGMIGAIGSSIVNGISGAAAAAQQFNYSKKLMAQQHDYNVADWNMQNEYNLPINQMQRYKDAGLNPALMYGEGGASNTGASMASVSGQQAPKVQYGTIDPLTASAILKNEKEGNAAEKNAETNAYNADTNAFIALARSKNLDADTQSKLISNEIQNATKFQQIAILGLKYEQDKVALSDSLYRIRNILPEIARQYQLNNQEIEKKIDLLVEQKNYTREMAAHAVADSLFLAAKTAGQWIENGISKKSAQYIIDTNLNKACYSLLQNQLGYQELRQRADHSYNVQEYASVKIPGIFDSRISGESLGKFENWSKKYNSSPFNPNVPYLPF